MIPYFCLFMMPLSVASTYSRRYFCTACAVNPGHVENYLLFIAFSSVCLGGLNAAWWRYFMSEDYGIIK